MLLQEEVSCFFYIFGAKVLTNSPVKNLCLCNTRTQLQSPIQSANSHNYKLSLLDNQIGDSGATASANAFNELTQLDYLSLLDNEISEPVQQ